MAEPAADVRAAPSWMYVNEVRLVAFVLGASMVVLGIGLLLYLAAGYSEMETVDVLLGAGVFFLVFALLLFVPRLRSRGAKSFSLLVEYSLDDVQTAVTAAVEESGRKAQVEVGRSRFVRPPREIVIDGLPWGFSLHAAPYREARGSPAEWTEIVQKGLTDEKDEVALELRERVLSRLATSIR